MLLEVWHYYLNYLMRQQKINKKTHCKFGPSQTLFQQSSRRRSFHYSNKQWKACEWYLQDAGKEQVRFEKLSQSICIVEGNAAKSASCSRIWWRWLCVWRWNISECYSCNKPLQRSWRPCEKSALFSKFLWKSICKKWTGSKSTSNTIAICVRTIFSLQKIVSAKSEDDMADCSIELKGRQNNFLEWIKMFLIRCKADR